LVLGAWCLALPAWGQNGETNGLPPATLERIPAESLNKISLSYRMGLNITVDFKKLGGLAAIGNPGPATGVANRTYDDGSYNRPDVSGSLDGYTWNWGYQNANQIQGNSIIMESSSSPNNGVSPDRQNDPQHGLELSYSRQLYRDNKYRFGVEAAFGWTTIDIADSHAVHTTVNRLVDSYAVPGGVYVVPAAPYNGTTNGPGPLLTAALGPAATDPSHRTITTIPQDALVTGKRTLNSSIYTLRLGPYVEVPVYKKLSFTLGGGLTLMLGDTDFSYRETVTIIDSGVTSPLRSGSVSQTDFLVGGYVEGTLSYALTREMSVFTGVQYQAAGQSVNDTHKVNGQAVTQKESVLDLGQSIMVVFGVSYSF
jgi:hypothetical protein